MLLLRSQVSCPRCRVRTNSTCETSRRKRKRKLTYITAILTDDEAESDGPDEIPAKGGKLPTRTPAKIPEGDVVDEADEDEDEDEDGEEYKVEGIEGHRFADDEVLEYRIKWLGYPKKVDQTWEPIGNLYGLWDS